MTFEQIEDTVAQLHKEIWRRKEILWPDRQPIALHMLEPRVAAQLLGVQYEEYPDLGSPRFGQPGARFVPAGILDRQAKKIAVSTAFPDPVMRFTAAHEVGHWMLHHDQIMHRDKALDGSQPRWTRPPVEREADHFGAVFLMPPNLVSNMFRAQFGVRDQFVFNDTSAYHLSPNDPFSLLYAEDGSLDREIALARCTHFNGKHMYSLASLFGVSDSAMAIRIKELNLVRWP
ncbi:hypothetical protein B6S59_01215 [Pseudomonas sp. A46]|nr:ImmA/IrrE family metallo-endopeptidase [Pseudomonas sp. A46]OWJ98225.1 hypothetical protein B6S59_01215 [Pseudomonas sp. A46]